MSAFYDRMQATALRLLTKFGREVQFSRTTGAAYDPATGTSGGSVEQQSAIVVVQQASAGTIEAFDIKFEDGTLIEANIRGLMIAAKGLGWMPVAGDKATFDGSDWTFIGCTPVNPAGTPLVYKASVRR